MTDKTICGAASLECAKRLVELIEQGNESAALETLETLSAIRESSLFQELGKLTRDLHNTINGFQLDSKITSMTQKDIPDAKERLNHVISLTEQAADSTLNAVEASLPVSEELQARVAQLQERWGRFRTREMDVNEFRSLSHDLDEFFKWLALKTPELHSNLSDILMAQGFQDLTGQIIRRVITLVQEVEESLVGLVRITGQKMQQVQPQEEKRGPDIAAAGPVVPGIAHGDVVNGQDDVDDLLSSLGF
jgi:chemotaxis protein CheZ